MRDLIAERFAARGAQISHSDLYAMGFNPVLSPADFTDRKDNAHLTYALEQRHGYQTGTLAPDVLAEIAKVMDADVIAFTFPMFWFSVPAILKGRIDRVFISGPIYGGRRIYGQGGLAGKRALVAFSLGGRDGMFGPGSLHGELETGMLRHFLQGTLGYAGLDVAQPFAAHHVPYLDAAARAGLLRDLATYVDGFDDVPIMPKPDLSGFDADFSPRSV